LSASATAGFIPIAAATFSAMGGKFFDADNEK
jgi:hypothetical protein